MLLIDFKIIHLTLLKEIIIRYNTIVTYNSLTKTK